ncbi:hypothetical protein DL771_008696 [Monosporascus sp. 5C6A]|nr:hypothetical protein DL771_008696 [Monosporascus sp. 5C6A]
MISGADTYIDNEERSAVQLSQDIVDVRTRRAGGIADDGAVQTHLEHGRTIQDLQGPRPHSREGHVRGRGRLRGDGPRHMATSWFPKSSREASPGEIAGRSVEYWEKARDLTQQQLYLDDGLEMLHIARECIPKGTFNPYHQARRGDFAVSHDRFHHVRADIFIELGGTTILFAFVFSDAFRALLTKGVERDVA